MDGLFTPLKVKELELPNRVVMPPMANELATEDGEVTPKLIEHYVRRAAAGVGLIIVEHSYVDPIGRVSPRQLGIYDDRLVPGLRNLVKEVHAIGGKIGIQITHGGSAASSKINGTHPEAPWAVAHPRGGEIPRQMTKDRIKEVVKAFVRGAKRAVEAGFDMVEIHGAHGYLLNQFYSPLTNMRMDEYGGDPNNRMRFPLEVVREVRAAVGPEVTLFYRLGADDQMIGGIDPEGGKYAAVRLADEGIDVLDISGGLIGSRPEGALQQGYFVYLAEEIKPQVGIPVMVTGGIREAEFAASLIRQGKTDLVGIGRALLENPRWVEKARAELLRA